MYRGKKTEGMEGIGRLVMWERKRKLSGIQRGKKLSLKQWEMNREDRKKRRFTV